MARKPRKLPPKRDRAAQAALGGSAVARAAYERPGGTHERRRPVRRVERQRAIQEGRDG